MPECANCKNKICCTDEMMSVELSIDFLFRLAKKLEIKPEDAFNQYCEIHAQLLPLNLTNGQPLCGTKISLKSPCSFLKQDCEINPLKPLTCIAFPASSVFAKEKPWLYSNYPCMNGALKGPSNEDLEIYETVLAPLVENAQKISGTIFFKEKRPILDLREIRTNFPKVDEYCKWIEGKIIIENETIDERDKRQTEICKIASEQINKKLTKETVFMRIRMIKPEVRARIQEINDSYFDMRLKYDI